MNAVAIVLVGFSALALGYFVLLNGFNLLFTVIAARGMANHLRARSHAATTDAFSSPLTPGISVLVPAFNEERVIVESVRSLLALHYPRHEVVVVNDGSTDETMARLHEEFDLAPVARVLRGAIPYACVRETYLSRRIPSLCVIDKENGGRADALNAGVDAARHPYVCAIDADTLIEKDALLEVVKPILDDPDLVIATSGSVRIANGCRIDHGVVVEERLPKNRLATFQVLEYLRAFLVGRVGWSSLNALPLISGAFGLFQRSLVETVGGFSTTTVTEDLELVLRLHRFLREREEPYRIEFVAGPVCWTEVPGDLKTLSSQRRRWQRGLGESLWLHRGMIGNPRYGALGVLALPFLLFFEFFGAGVELAGIVATLAAYALGWLSLPFVLLFLALSLLLAIVLSVAASALEQFGALNFSRGRDVARLLAYAVVESFGYRQLVFADLARRKKGWGLQQRQGFDALPGSRVPTREPIGARVAPVAAPALPPPAVALVAELGRRLGLWELGRQPARAGDDVQAGFYREALLFELRSWSQLDGTIPEQSDELVRESFDDSGRQPEGH
jgi:cellulose synthase/poly-beta-1,6-N-acetylglucosamine synthase-like glycosyltransferase